MVDRIVVLVAVFAAIGLGWPESSRPAVTAPNGDQAVAGQLIVELNPDLRGKVNITTQDGIVLFGIPALDELNRRWQVDDITALFRHPNPGPVARKYGCDLQYVVQFSPGLELSRVLDSYGALSEVNCAVPNALLELDEEPNDPLYGDQWHLSNIGAPFGWDVAKGDTLVMHTALDDGCDWAHPDIHDNLWINHEEDLNGNGQYDSLAPPDGDVDGLDQDYNGYADDVIGFDFYEGESNPMASPGSSHGTHCSGVVNAITNNAEGVAGAAWNIRSMICRCGGGGAVNLANAIAAIYYAVPEGVWAVSMSFGGSSPYQPMADACWFGWESGATLFGSAGNDGQEAVRYPACYNGVENVAASNAGNLRASWSNYGTWVDVTAPGEGILSTVTRASGSYRSMDGTSMSCPLASGVTCWIKSFDPGLSNASAVQVLHDACDSMPDPLYPQGKLGAGRVSMANVVLPHFFCDLRMIGWSFDDNQGNNNGQIDPGETANLVLTLRNTEGWQDASGIVATIACNSRWVSFDQDTAAFPDIAAGDTGNCSGSPFVVAVDSGAPPQELKFLITIDAEPDPAYPDTALTSISGEPRVLLVDDDIGEDYEKWYEAALDSNGVLYDYHEVQTGGVPPTESLQAYSVVIWYTGDDTATTLTTEEQASITGFLDAGGNLLISGQNIAQNIGTDGFLTDYLHAEFVDPSTRIPFVVGYDGDPITSSRGDTMVAGGGGGAGNGTSNDAVRPVNGGVGCAYFKEYSDSTAQAIIRYAGTYRVVYFSVPFEAIAHSSTRYTQKWTLLDRILRYFGEQIPGVSEGPPSVAEKRPYVLSIAPNPFSGQALVRFVAPASGEFELRTYATDGRLVDAQKLQAQLGRTASFPLDGQKLSNGVYLVQLVTPAGVYAQKVAVLK